MKMVGRKDVRSDSMAERHLMRQTELIDRTKIHNTDLSKADDAPMSDGPKLGKTDARGTELGGTNAGRLCD